MCAVGHNDGGGRPRVAAVGVAVGGAGAGAGNVTGSGSGDGSGNGIGSGDGAGAGDGKGRGVGGEGQGPVWMLRQGTLKAYWEDYQALECTKGDGELSCALANATHDAVGSAWVGCGLQLSLGRDIIGVGYGGLNCSAVGLEVVES